MNPVVGPYELVSELGRGGMGVVYLANEPALERRVAVKFLSEAFAVDSDVRERFLIEARSMARVTDPHVVQVFAVGETEGHPYFAMEFLDGGSLDQLRRGSDRLTPLQAGHYIYQAALGLHAAHEADLVHRDIKPANLLLSAKGLLKVSDFGIAYAPARNRARLTATGGVVGTPGYLSPEICLGNPANARSDQFALGVVFFELLTGRVPFEDPSPLRAMMATVESDVPDLRQFDVEVPAAVEAVLRKMLAKRPEDRYYDLGQVADALVALGVDTRLRAVTPNDGGAKPVQRPSRLKTPATQVFRPGASAETTAWPDDTTTGPSAAQPAKPRPRARAGIAIAAALAVAGALAAAWWLRPPAADVAPTTVAAVPSVATSATSAPADQGSSSAPAEHAAATTDTAQTAAANTPPVPTTQVRPTATAPAVVAPASTNQLTGPAPANTDGLPIAVIAIGDPRIAQAVSTRLQGYLQSHGANFVDAAQQAQWLGLAKTGDLGTADALMAAAGKAVAMVVVEPDEDEPGTYSVRIYEVRSRVSRGHWTVQVPANGDPATAAASLDDFALAEIRRQIAGYGG
jgi:eukaryotic-like serine/threonine-protein kinase